MALYQPTQTNLPLHNKPRIKQMQHVAHLERRPNQAVQKMPMDRLLLLLQMVMKTVKLLVGTQEEVQVVLLALLVEVQVVVTKDLKMKKKTIKAKRV